MLTEVLKRKKRLASAHANKKGMFSVLTAILTIPFLLLSIFLPVFLIGLFALFLAFIILSSGLLYYGAKKRGPIYVFEAIFFEYFFSLAIGFGGISISFKQYTKKVKNFFWKYLNLFRMFITGRPTYLIFYVTSICNSRCKMCFNWKYNNSKSIKNEFTLEEIYRFSKKAGYLQYVTLGGGEPFLRKDIDEICRIFYENSHTEIFSIPTNCMNPEFIRVKTRKMLEKCPNAIFRISMSIDGIGDLHDFIRGVKGNFKKVEETYKVLRKLREEYPNLEILANTTFSIYNQDKIKEIHDFIKKNFRTDMYGLTLVRGNTRNLVSKNIDLGKYEKAIKIFENEYFNNKGEKRHPLQRLLTILPIFTRREVLKTAVSQKRTYDCYAISKFVVVDSFGNVFACEMLPNKLGDLRKENYDLKKILDKLENKRLKHYIKNKGCNCTWECAIQNSTVFNYGKYPTMFYEAFVK
jgi:MoaA/NifB/PqqE/SkfB family radical SAM enzyme